MNGGHLFFSLSFSLWVGVTTKLFYGRFGDYVTSQSQRIRVGDVNYDIVTGPKAVLLFKNGLDVAISTALKLLR